jgi:hypothetical protein
MEQALDRVAPWAGIALAESLICLGKAKIATAYLAKALRSDNLMVRLQAMETIVVTGLLAPELKPAIAALIPDDPKQRLYDARMARYVIQEYEKQAGKSGGSGP